MHPTSFTPHNSRHSVVRVILPLVTIWTSISLAVFLEPLLERVLVHLCINPAASRPASELMPLFGTYLAILQVLVLWSSVEYWQSGGLGDTARLTTYDAISLIVMEILLDASVVSWTYDLIWVTVVFACFLYLAVGSTYGMMIESLFGRPTSPIFRATIAFFSAFSGEVLLPLVLFSVAGDTEAGGPATLCSSVERAWFMLAPFLTVNAFMLVMGTLADDGIRMIWYSAAAWADLVVVVLDQTSPYIQSVAILCVVIQLVAPILLSPRKVRKTATEALELGNPSSFTPTQIHWTTPENLVYVTPESNYDYV